MKELIKKSIALFLFTIILYPILIVHAQTDLKIEKKTYITTGSRSEAKYKTNKGFAYCITPDRIGASEGTSLKYMSKETSGGNLYILDKSSTSDQEYLKTQLALWIFNNNYMPSFYGNNPNLEVVQKAKALAAEAKKHTNYQTSEPSVTINTNEEKLTLTSDEKYYQSSVISIRTTGSNSKLQLELVDAPEGSFIEDDSLKINNNAVNKIIMVPSDKIKQTTSFKLKAIVSGTINSVERYGTKTGEWQDLIVLISDSKTSSQIKTFTISPVIRTCEFHNNNYYDKDGNITTEEEYEIQCKTHTCEKVGNTYFGKTGEIIKEETYNLECISHTCEKVGNKYFGQNGNEVNEEEYKAQCQPQEVVVPDTNSPAINDLYSILLGSVLVGSMIGTISYQKEKK